jgi:hypothetical protein
MCIFAWGVVVPIPMLPVASTVKSEEVAAVVDDAISKSVGLYVSLALAWMATFAHGLVVPTPTLPDEFQMPEPAKYALPETLEAVDDALVTVKRAAAESNKSEEESVKAPLVVINGTRPLVREETVSAVVEAVAKYPVPLTVIAVEEAYVNAPLVPYKVVAESAVVDAYGKTEAVVPVEMKRIAVGVVVATTPPVASVARRLFWILEMVRLEVDAVAKYPVPLVVSAVVDAYGKVL